MFSLAMIPYSVRGSRVVLHYLTRTDRVWVEGLIAEYEAHVGRTKQELTDRLNGPLPAAVPKRQAALVRQVLDHLYRPQTHCAAAPVRIRRVLFREAALWKPEHVEDLASWKRQVVGRAADELGLTSRQVLDGLYGDMPHRRIVTAPAESPTPDEVIGMANLSMAQTMVARSQDVEIELDSQVRPVVRMARLLGLICTVDDPSTPDARIRSGLVHPFRQGARLHVSGPLSLFRHTLKYGRALARLLPGLAWSPRWRLVANCYVEGRMVEFVADHSDHLVSATNQPNLFDSKLEARFFKDVSKLAPDWDVLREPEPVSVGHGFMFPDFALVSPDQPEEKVLVELVGFWTTGYLRRKLAGLAEAGLERIIVCVDESLGCVQEDLPVSARLIPFRKKIDAAVVLEQAKQLLEGAGPIRGGRQGAQPTAARQSWA